jgi:hypothetical protein
MIVKKIAQSTEMPKGRKFAQSGHPVADSRFGIESWIGRALQGDRIRRIFQLQTLDNFWKITLVDKMFGLFFAENVTFVQHLTMNRLGRILGDFFQQSHPGALKCCWHTHSCV